MHPETIRGQAVTLAKQYLGVKYRWQGRSQYGLDCVGLLKVVGDGLGFEIDYPSNYTAVKDARILLKLQTHFAETPSLQEGNILLFEFRSLPHHVGLYLGNNLFIHTMMHKNVHISALTPNWQKRLLAIYDVTSFQA